MREFLGIFRQFQAGLNISTGHRTIPAKNRVMSNENCFATDTVVQRELRQSFYKLPSS